MFHPHILPLTRSPQPSHLDRAIDLPPVQLLLRQLIDLLQTETGQGLGPELAALGVARGGDFERQVDAGFESGVEGFGAVGGDEDDAAAGSEVGEEC